MKNPFVKLTPQQQAQLQRIGAANRRRLTATLSYLPRPRQAAPGSPAERRDARALSRVRASRQWRN